ncbi:MAG: hypothetical protein AB8F74_07390 [Saprospiraceae bacterium]
MKNVIFHHHQLPILWLCIITLGVASLTFSSCSKNRITRLKNKSYKKWSAYQFKAIKESSNRESKKWTIYSRKIRGTSFLEYKIEGDIEASPKACLAAFRQDMLRQAADLNNKKYPTYEVVTMSKDSLLTYVIHNEPFPFRDTEMSVKYVFFNDENGGAEVRWREGWEESQVQLSKKLKRVETFRGAWRFDPTSDNSCEATNSVQFDPKGMPLWLVRPMVFKFLKKGLDDIRNTTSKEN